MILFFLVGLLYLLLLIATPLLIYPEFFFYPWLIAKGFVQYKDFFDDHGFFTNIFFSPFATNIELVSFIFIALQLIQFCVMAYLICKKTSQNHIYFLLLSLYGLFQYSIVSQQIWYDAIMAFFIVIAWYLFEEKKEYFGWLFVAIATMIKPTVGLFVPFLFFASKNKKTCIVFFVSWLIGILYFLSRGAMGELWQQLVVFNFGYAHHIYKTFTIGISYKLLAFLCIGLVMLLGLVVKQKKRNIPLLIMTIISFSFFGFGFAKLNFSLFVPFFVLQLSDCINDKRTRRYALFLLVIFNVIFVRDAYKTYRDCQTRQVYITPFVVEEAKKVSSFIEVKNGKNILVIGNHVELYYFLDTLPPEFIPLHFPWITNVYPNDLKIRDIQYMIIPRKFGQYETMNPFIQEEQKKHFRQIGQTTSYTVWRYNKE